MSQQWIRISITIRCAVNQFYTLHVGLVFIDFNNIIGIGAESGLHMLSIQPKLVFVGLD